MGRDPDTYLEEDVKHKNPKNHGHATSMVYKKSEKPRSCDKKKDTDVTQTICQSHETGPQGRVLLTFLIFDKHGKQKIRKATVMQNKHGIQKIRTITVM